jgi:hypothetical protein
MIAANAAHQRAARMESPIVTVDGQAAPEISARLDFGLKLSLSERQVSHNVAAA